jgi:hypothetical protein
MLTFITPEQQCLHQNLYEAATNFNCCTGDGELEAVATEHALIALENAGYVDGKFISIDNTEALRNAALSLLNVLAAEGSTNARNERELLLLALANGGVK